MYANIVFAARDDKTGYRVEVNSRLAGNYSLVCIDTNANEIFGFYLFSQQEEAIAAANSFITHWKNLK